MPGDLLCTPYCLTNGRVCWHFFVQIDYRFYHMCRKDDLGIFISQTFAENGDIPKSASNKRLRHMQSNDIAQLFLSLLFINLINATFIPSYIRGAETNWFYIQTGATWLLHKHYTIALTSNARGFLLYANVLVKLSVMGLGGCQSYVYRFFRVIWVKKARFGASKRYPCVMN